MLHLPVSLMNRLKSNGDCDFQTLDAIFPKDPLFRLFKLNDWTVGQVKEMT